MNEHFEDSLDYLKRAGETAKAGVGEELAPIERRVRSLVGAEEPVERGRVDELRARLAELAARTEGETREAIEAARERLDAYRGRRVEA